MARIVFDLDGTLVHSAPDIRATANAVLTARGAAPLTMDETVSFIGSGAPVFVERMRAARALPEADAPDLLDAFLALYEDAHALTEPFPGVREALDALRGAGHRLAICTNKPEGPARALLAHLDLADPFDAVVGGDTLAVRKPDPAPLFAAAEALGTGPLAYVGDSETDAETAVAAAVPFLLFTGGYRKSPVTEIPHRAAFDSFDTLAALVGRHAGDPLVGARPAP
ncbi:phosphoglycolate phosphatase [Roseivivax sediminis]|uniref:Phosphoglycolate phosphatase n=1 Tax=Roseivivax sediminis TaxID=936889 RepID=A0A1I1ZKH3_9RHOB|nr:phosphoglycolate phosphatase [Roseivivax sediminis]SFE32207.1 phosphoglycolate phosphatase [Roseivivax sediminis]